MKVNLNTLGCRLNEAETESWGTQFQNAGHHIVTAKDQADLFVINTCAVTTEATRKSRQMIRRLHRQNPTAKMVVSGCYATLNRDAIAESLGVDLVISNADKDQLVDLTHQHIWPETMPAPATEPGEHALFKRGRQRAFIKVQDGCRYRCTFCIVTIARGQEKSRPIRDIVTQVNALHEQGVNEAVLTGVHLGGYGNDRGENLGQLIRAILEQTDIPRIRLGSLEPWELGRHFFGLFENSRLMPHLHLPLQSGCNSVLRRMARRCKVSDFMQLVEQARRDVPDINITTDIIVGFPGETEQEWSEGLANIRQIGFGHIHIFTYSQRESTKAAQMPNPVPTEIKRRRSKTLHNLAVEMKHATYSRFQGREFPILWEGNPEQRITDQIYGYTPNFLRVSADTVPGIENTIRRARLGEINSTGEYLTSGLIGSKV